jgi:acetoacetate decarboxylase
MTITDDLAVVRDFVQGAASYEAVDAALDRIEREYAEEVALNESAIRARLTEAERLLRLVPDVPGTEALVSLIRAFREQEDA